MSIKNDTDYTKANISGKGTIIKGAAGSGKTELLFERYKYMVGKLGIPADTILVLHSGSQRLQNWKDGMDSEIAAGLKCFTYTGFIQDEINTYYPLITMSDKEIGIKEITPLNIGYDASKFLVSRSVQLRRERAGAFRGLVSTNENAAAQLLKSLSQAAAYGIPAEEAVSRLTDALESKNEVRNGILSEADSIMKAFRSKCLELGILDSALNVSVYNEYLLKNTSYRETLQKRIRHVLAYDLQEYTPAQLNLIEILLETSESYAFTLNSGIHGDVLNAHIFDFINNLEQSGCEMIKLQQSYTCSPEIYNFSEKLACSKQNDDGYFSVDEDPTADSGQKPDEAQEKLQKPAFIERHASVELRSEMLQQLGERVCSLVYDQGYKPSDILILSTHADIVTELALHEILEARRINLFNLSRHEKFNENTLCRSIIAFMQLCHPNCRLYLTRDDLRLMLNILLRLDKVRCTILAGLISVATPFPTFPEENREGLPELVGEENMKRYIYIKHWMEDYIKVGNLLPAGDFIMKVLAEVFLDDETGRDELIKVRKMADAAFRYEGAASRLGRNIIKDFTNLCRSQAFVQEDPVQDGGQPHDDYVVLSTPAAFLTGNLRCKAVVICSLSSRNWLQGGAGELYNPYVLNNRWNSEDAYTAAKDELNRWKQMTQTLGMVFKKCGERIITFESGLSENGFENDGPLPSLFDMILKN